MCAEVPDCEKPDAEYIISSTLSVGDLPLNMALNKTWSLFDPLDKLEDYDDVFVLLRKPSVVANWRKDSSFA